MERIQQEQPLRWAVVEGLDFGMGGDCWVLSPMESDQKVDL